MSDLCLDHIHISVTWRPDPIPIRKNGAKMTVCGVGNRQHKLFWEADRDRFQRKGLRISPLIFIEVSMIVSRNGTEDSKQVREFSFERT